MKLQVEGEKVGGKAAATNAPSAAAIAKLLSGIEFPKGKHEIVNYAEKNKQKVTKLKEILDTLKEIPDKKYHNMIEIEKAIGHMR
jgi:ubiquinone biosynthesis protein COQ9